jgi:hypothetical protein
VLDNDVDAGVQTVLIKAGHECWRAPGSVIGEDDAVSVYSHDHDAVVVTHDREFTGRRRKNTFGKHVRLNCEQPDGPALVLTHLDELVRTLGFIEAIVVVVSPGGVRHFPPHWE